ncbi:MAG: FmdB family zinc ribbon protein [Dehalococcoidia bacterium]|nr:zinc ribbon domain-containing protein [Dehalococcoidia bacterium]MDZ4247457.1 FmdB family zinc ribbon protein [Dehalococcoidia bacterium]
MPIYEYKCPECGSFFDLMRPLSLCDEKAPCPGCSTPSDKLTSVCATNCDYRIRFPVKEAFRGTEK